MVALYNATDGHNWANQDNWFTYKPLGEWFGITTDERGRVTEINLERNNLRGHIPPELSHLQRLERLNLSKNPLTGALPEGLTKLTKLTHLILDFNLLTGPIPTGLGQLTDLTVLDLRANRLTGPIPPSLVASTSLTQLDLSANLLTGSIPRNFAHESNLKELKLDANQLTSKVPVEIERLQNLEELNLGDNQLEGEIPAAISKLSKLERLSLQNNRLTGRIPAALSDLKQLRLLILDNNQLSGRVPPEIAEIETLDRLGIVDNYFSGCVPSELRTVRNSNIDYANINVCGETPSRIEIITPTYIQWIIGDEVTASQERAARLGNHWLAEYLELIRWPTPQNRIDFYLGDFNAIAQRLADDTEGCDLQCAKDRLERLELHWIDAGARPGVAYSAPFSTRNTGLAYQARIVAFETVRAVQFTLMDENQQPSFPGRPIWLVEGTAYLIERLANSRGRDAPFSETRDRMVDAANGNDATLSAIEGSAPACFHQCGALAVELLASQVGLRRLADYYTERTDDDSWQQTFQRVFNITVPDFYARFEQHRLDGFPELQLPIVGTITWPQTSSRTP